MGLEEAKKQIASGIELKKLLEVYSTKLDLHEAFFVITQAQISLRENKKK